MKQLIEFPLEDGGTVLVEVDEPKSAAGRRQVSRSGEKAVKAASENFETALTRVKPTANAVIATLRDLVEQPDEIGVEFGLKFTAETDLVLAAAGVEANFKVTLKWQKNGK